MTSAPTYPPTQCRKHGAPVQLVDVIGEGAQACPKCAEQSGERLVLVNAVCQMHERRRA